MNTAVVLIRYLFLLLKKLMAHQVLLVEMLMSNDNEDTKGNHFVLSKSNEVQFLPCDDERNFCCIDNDVTGLAVERLAKLENQTKENCFSFS
mgnify:CR=1 FL=1